jgi:hypothetical protein
VLRQIKDERSALTVAVHADAQRARLAKDLMHKLANAERTSISRLMKRCGRQNEKFNQIGAVERTLHFAAQHTEISAGLPVARFPLVALFVAKTMAELSWLAPLSASSCRPRHVLARRPRRSPRPAAPPAFPGLA